MESGVQEAQVACFVYFGGGEGGRGKRCGVEIPFFVFFVCP